MAARFWFPGQPYTVSLAGAIASIMYMRWGYWGGIHAALAGTGVMDYREILKFMKERKPYIQATLENTEVQHRSGIIDLTFQEDEKVHFLEFR